MIAMSKILSDFSLDDASEYLSWDVMGAKECGHIIKALRQKINNAEPHPSRDIEKFVCYILISRISDQIRKPNLLISSPLSDIILGIYAANIKRQSESVFLGSALNIFANNEPLSAEAILRSVEDFVLSSRCTVKHPLFGFLRNEATFTQLAGALWAENPADLNFVNILAFLMQGLDGEAGIEIASNFYDEIGQCNLNRFHMKMRLEMMKNVGLPPLDEYWSIDTYLTEEFEHFNSYCVFGANRNLIYRLIGMMYATEYLVPSQLDAVIQGWRRVGLPDSKMAYLLEHAAGDVEHGHGWAKHVVRPNVQGNLFRQQEVLIGVVQHVSVLTRFYDALYRHLEMSR